MFGSGGGEMSLRISDTRMHAPSSRVVPNMLEWFQNIEVINNNFRTMGISWNNATCGVKTCSLRPHVFHAALDTGMIEQMNAELPICLETGQKQEKMNSYPIARPQLLLVHSQMNSKATRLPRKLCKNKEKWTATQELSGHSCYWYTHSYTKNVLLFFRC